MRQLAIVKSQWLVLIFCLLVSAAVYGNTLHNEFVFDDFSLVVDNELLRSPAHLPKIFGLTEWKIPYRPLRTASYVLDYALTGEDPLAYHISNMVYHGLVGFFVFLIARLLWASPRRAVFAALLFLVHPIQTDAVAYISGRRDILFTLFYLMGFWIAVRSRSQRRSGDALLLGVCYLAALASKEMAVTLPVLLLAYDAYAARGWRAWRTTVHTYWVQYAVLAVPMVLGLIHWLFIESPSHRLAWYGDSWPLHVLTVARVLVYDLRLLLWPVGLNADYSYNAFPASISWWEPQGIAALVLLAALCWAWRRCWIAHSWCAWYGLWMVVTILPVCHIIPHHELLAEHYLYLPSVGWCLALAHGLAALARHRAPARQITMVCTVALVMFYGTNTVLRNRDWKDGVTLWSITTQRFPECARAHYSLAMSHMRRGEVSQVEPSLRKALDIEPDNEKALFQLADLLRTRGEPIEAIQYYEQLVMLDPDDVKMRSNVAALLMQQGRSQEAVTHLQAAVDIAPDSAALHMNLGGLYAGVGQIELAVGEIKRALELKPEFVEARFNLAMLYATQRRVGDARRELGVVLQANPDFLPARKLLRQLQHLPTRPRSQ